MKRISLILLFASLFAATGTTAQASLARIPTRWKNCTAVNKRYPHGVGRNNAHDKPSASGVASLPGWSRYEQAQGVRLAAPAHDHAGPLTEGSFFATHRLRTPRWTRAHFVQKWTKWCG